MDISATREVIVSLKQVKDQKHYSIADIKKKVEESGVFLSETTLRRVFADGSEDNDSFNYEQTVRPIARVLVGDVEESDKAVMSQIDLFRHICEYKLEVIDSLHKQVDSLKEENEMRCREYDKRMAFLRDQIELKDRRMDEQAQRIDRLIERIDKLMDKLLEKV